VSEAATRELLVGLQNALPAVETWISTLHERHASASVATSATGCSRLGDYVQRRCCSPESPAYDRGGSSSRARPCHSVGDARHPCFPVHVGRGDRAARVCGESLRKDSVRHAGTVRARRGCCRPRRSCQRHARRTCEETAEPFRSVGLSMGRATSSGSSTAAGV
jgi:hypothetical protein